MITTANIRFNNSNIAYITVDPDTHELTGGVMDETTGIFYPIGGGSEMQLYGPYVATNSTSQTVTTGSGGPVTLDALFSYDMDALTYPASDAIIMVSSVNSGSYIELRGFNSPSYYEGTWSDAIVNVVNNMDSDQTIDANRALVIFYSSVEFPVSE